MPFNYKTPKLPGLPRLGGGSGSRSRRDLEEEERRRRMLRGAGGLGGLGGAAPPRRAQPQKSAMFQKAGGLPFMPKRMTPMSGAAGAGVDSEYVWPGDAEETDVDTGDPSTDDDYVWPGDEEETDVDTLDPAPTEEELAAEAIREGEGEGEEEYPEYPDGKTPDDEEDFLDADDPSELDALFEDIIEGLESDIPEIRQNAMNEMNAALRRQAEINANLGRSVGGGFGGAMATTTARGLEALARSEGDARNRIRQAQLSWLDRRLRQQGGEDAEDREMRLAILDMLKDVDDEELMERYGKTDLGEIIDDIMGSGGLGGGDGEGDGEGDGGGDGGGDGEGDDAGAWVSDGRTYSSTGYTGLDNMGSVDGSEISHVQDSNATRGATYSWQGNTLTGEERAGAMYQLAGALEAAGLEGIFADYDEQHFQSKGHYLEHMLMRAHAPNEVGMELIGYMFKYREENGQLPSGMQLWGHIQRMHMEGSLEDSMYDEGHDAWLGGEDEDED